MIDMSEDFPRRQCPECGGEITGDPFEIDEPQVYREVWCTRCLYSWQEVYTFSHSEYIDNEHNKMIEATFGV